MGETKKMSSIWNILHGSDSDNLPKIISLHEFSLSLKTFQAISYSIGSWLDCGVAWNW